MHRTLLEEESEGDVGSSTRSGVGIKQVQHHKGNEERSWLTTTEIIPSSSTSDASPAENRELENERAEKEMLAEMLNMTHITQSDIPLRLDRLPWSRWHWLVVLSLGVSWILDGLEMTIVSIMSGVLQNPDTLGFTSHEIGATGTVHILGCIIGSLIFGYIADRYGRKTLFLVTPSIYLLATILSAFTWDFWSFTACQFFKGLGIGGEYAAMNSAINELIPARIRGWVDITINGSYWLGAALAAVMSLFLLDTNIFPVNIGWRITFGVGGVLGLGIIIARLWLPESPRWLIAHGKYAEAEETVTKIEAAIERSTGEALPRVERTIAIKYVEVSFIDIARIMFQRYLKRSILGVSLMVAQAFFYNAIFFTYALILVKFYNVPEYSVGLFLIPFALGNFLGAGLLGVFFDRIGRKPMICGTYSLAGLLLLITGILFAYDLLDKYTQTVCWCLIFFVASPGASAAYLTISEIFPVEIRSMAISFFYTIGTGAGGLVAPWLFGFLIQQGEPLYLFYGYAVGSALMFVAALMELAIGVKSERQTLEEISSA